MPDLTGLLHCGSVRRLDYRTMDEQDIAPENPMWRRNVRAWALEHVLEYAHDCDDVQMIANVAPALIPGNLTTWPYLVSELYDLADVASQASLQAWPIRHREVAEQEYRDHLLTIVS